MAGGRRRRERDSSVRQAGYPVTYNFTTKIDDVNFGKIARTTSRKVRFKFHIKAKPGFESQLKFLHTECKLDDKRYRKCDSPKRYKGRDKGRHRFKVKAV
jgi:hypothetical protein